MAISHERHFSEVAMRAKWKRAIARSARYRKIIQTLRAQVKRLTLESQGLYCARLDEANRVISRQRKNNKQTQEKLRKFEQGRDAKTRALRTELQSAKMSLANARSELGDLRTKYLAIKDRCKCQGN